MRFCISCLVLLSYGVRSDQLLPAAQPKERTNFVFFLVDDLGWADVSCFGSTYYETPNIDALCATGMKFTQGYAACPVCSPTRASIMTGRHPVRVDITDWIPGMSAARAKDVKFLHVEDRDNLALKEVTIAEALKANGYQTFFAGKWHLGNEGHWPTDQGFDFNIGGCEKGSPPGGYYAPWKNPTLKATKNWKLIEFYHWEKVELYNLKSDPGETSDLSKTYPDQTKELLTQLHAWQQRLGAKLPTPIR